jgi:hypothetical protein
VSQQLAIQAARRSVLEIQVALRRERADRERRLEALAITVLTALGERDVLVRDAELWTGQALRTMTDDEAYRCGKPSTGAAAASLCER